MVISMKNIYTMKLHEFMEFEPHLSVVRVPGGWIYRDGRGEYQPENTFVPFNNEFMEVKGGYQYRDKDYE